MKIVGQTTISKGFVKAVEILRHATDKILVKSYARTLERERPSFQHSVKTSVLLIILELILSVADLVAKRQPIGHELTQLNTLDILVAYMLQEWIEHIISILVEIISLSGVRISTDTLERDKAKDNRRVSKVDIESEMRGLGDQISIYNALVRGCIVYLICTDIDVLRGNEIWLRVNGLRTITKDAFGIVNNVASDTIDGI